MKNLIGISFIGIVASSLFSCGSKRLTSNIESRYYTDSIYSKKLSEYRKHNIYLPEKFDREKTYAIIYSTDGEEITSQSFIKKTLDSLIGLRIIKPIIYVSSHANDRIADSTTINLGNSKKLHLQYRNFEYVRMKNIDVFDSVLKDRFQNHMDYFKNELIAHIEERNNQHISKSDRYFYGESNGAGFGLSLLNNSPNLIGTYICFSAYGGDVQTNTWNKDVEYPNLYLAYGSYESSFMKENTDFLKTRYEECKSNIYIEVYKGGHDSQIWQREFIKTIVKLFGQ
jgi:enterochelin esterase-like enzyme